MSSLFQATTDDNELTDRRVTEFLVRELPLPIEDLRGKVHTRVLNADKSTLEFLEIDLILTRDQIDRVLVLFQNLEFRATGKPIDPDRGV